MDMQTLTDPKKLNQMQTEAFEAMANHYGVPYDKAQGLFDRYTDDIQAAAQKYQRASIAAIECLQANLRNLSTKLEQEETTEMADRIKDVGFRYATRSGTSIAMSDLIVPQRKYEILEEAEKQVGEVERQFRRGLLTDDEQLDRARERLDAKLQKLIEDGGFKLLAWGDGGKNRVFSAQEFSAPGDLAGKPAWAGKDNAIGLAYVQALGAKPIRVGASGVLPGLKSA